MNKDLGDIVCAISIVSIFGILIGLLVVGAYQGPKDPCVKGHYENRLQVGPMLKMVRPIRTFVCDVRESDLPSKKPGENSK